jgi:hypothetical protein
MEIALRAVTISLFFILFGHSLGVGQQIGKINFTPPLGIPLFLAGTFGEIRSNHLHTGTDFRTLGITGLNVYAMEEGYISRIKIEPEGYGKAVYITHPGGYVSMYAHLERLRDDLEKCCKKEQYKQNLFSVDIFLKANEFHVKKGDCIAWSGNSGGTSGPHLHLEIRAAKSQDPLNALLYLNKQIHDTISPIIEKLWIYPLTTNSSVNHQFARMHYSIVATKNYYSVKNEPVLVKGAIGIGLQAYDRTDVTNIRSGIYSIDLYVNNKLIFEQVVDRVSFSEGRYVNSLIDFEQYIRNHERINRLYLQPNNHFSIYHQVIDHGIINFTDTSTKSIVIRVKDVKGNESLLSFKLKGDLTPPKQIKPEQINSEMQPMDYEKDNLFQHEKVRLFLPKNALYDNLLFEYSTLPGKNYYSEIHRIHNPYTPLHKSASLSIKATNLPVILHSKALLLNLDEKGTIQWSGGSFKDGFVVSNIRTFGNYTISIDTVAPTIKFNNTLQNTDFTNWKRIAFTIKDNLSGIKSYQGFIDGQWVCFNYDPKQDLVYHEFDQEQVQFNHKHKLELVVTDEKNNVAKYHIEFFK